MWKLELGDWRMGRRVRAKFQTSKGVISNQNIEKKLQGAEKRERVEWGWM